MTSRRISTWIALWAMVALTLIPSISRAWTALNSPSDWVEVCTAQGARWVSLTDSREPQPEAPATAEHCAYCQLQGHALALPPTSAGLVLMVDFDEIPPLFYGAPYQLEVWRTAAARGPPVAN